MLRNYLEMQGLQVWEAETAALAVSVLESGNADVVIAPVEHGSGIGTEVLRQVRASASLSHIPVLGTRRRNGRPGEGLGFDAVVCAGDREEIAAFIEARATERAMAQEAK